MKNFILLLAITTITIFVTACHHNEAGETKFKGKFEIKAMCSNYTFSLLEGKMDSTLLEANWTDDITKLSYTNVFAITNPCSLPDTLKQGDEFYFVMDTAAAQQCATCMAYYPVPGKKLAIKVVEK